MEFNNTTPILRIFDEQKAKEFYIDFLEFRIDWEHRFAEGLPLYMQISQGNCIIHLSEHNGDCSPGAAIRIATKPLDEYHKKLNDKKYKFARPGIEDQPWGSREMCVTDPFHNRLIFSEDITQ